MFKPFETETRVMTFGGFRVQAFDVPHSVPCYGFVISHKKLKGYFIFATDCEYIGYSFAKLKPAFMLVEANYDKDLIDNKQESYNHSLTGHMEITTTEEFIKHNMSDSLKHVVLCHLSGRNANKADFMGRVQKIVHNGCSVAVAQKGLEIEL